MSESPYARALGDTAGNLHPRLRAYFSSIPDGCVGRGKGTFDVVGTPRRWLWPVLAVLSADDILLPVWERNVAFDIENRQSADGLVARRVFHLRGGDRVMVDRMRWAGGPVDVAIGGRLVDAIGTRGDLRAAFAISVQGAALLLRSTNVGLRLGRWRVSLPTAIRPRVTLVERIDAITDRQHVRVSIELPVIGRIYEYAGSFDYEVRPEGEP